MEELKESIVEKRAEAFDNLVGHVYCYIYATIIYPPKHLTGSLKTQSDHAISKFIFGEGACA